MQTDISRAEAKEDVKAGGHGLTVVIPAFNEEAGVGSVAAALSIELASGAWPFEVIVVDDGSSDATAEQAEKASVRVVRHESNRGYGAALKTGIRRARYDVICITDADGTYPNERIPDLVARREEHKADMVVGARVGDNVAIPLVRRPAKWVLSRLANLVAGRDVPDLNSGLRLFRRKDALRFFSILPDGFSFTTTITLGMLASGYVVDFVPIDYRARIGRSKIRPVRDTLNFVGLVMRIALYFAPLKVFLPLSGLMLVAAAVWGVLSKVLLGTLADVSTVVIVMAAIQIAVLGLIAELVNRRLPNYFRDVE